MLNSFGSNPIVTNCTFRGNSASTCGGMYNNDSSPMVVNCTFGGNTASGFCGGMYNYDNSSPTVINCTFTGNSAGTGEGGGIYSSSGSTTTVTNCILWDNTPDQAVNFQSDLTITYSCVQGGFTGDGNIDVDPLLTPDGHLKTGSPCIDAGDNTAIPADVTDLDGDDNTTEPVPYDIDAEDRIMPGGGTVDMGADEFADADTDGLPDWWETSYPTATDPGGDPDGDELTNLAEYEEYSTNPIASPILVHPAWPYPYNTIQYGLDLASDGDTVLVVCCHIYSGTGNVDLDYAGKWVVVRATGGSATIDCGGSGRAVNKDTIKGTFAVLEGFTITNGQAVEYGGGLLTHQSRFMLKNCVLSGNAAGGGGGGGIYSERSNPTINSLTIQTNTSPVGDGGLLEFSSMNLRGDLTLEAGILEVRSGWFDGPGSINLNSGTLFLVNAPQTPGYAATSVRNNINGPGDIEIVAGQQLIIGGSAVVDLNRQAGDTCDSAAGGRIIVDGTLIAKDQATIQNTTICVNEAEFGNANTIHNNNIKLLEASAGYGGEFFVQDNATISDNTIFSEGDRYLDLDPDANNPNLNITNNTIYVTITQGVAGGQGTLLELRALDYDQVGQSGAFQAIDSPGFTPDPSANWVLEELGIQAGAKLNLTSRQGFEFQGPGQLETVYVRKVILHPNAVLNTALQTLYYEELVLVDEQGGETVWSGGPPYPETFPNGARIVDIPVLGFSLVNIAMNDDTPSPFNEFDIRVRIRITDPIDFDPAQPNKPLPEGSIRRLSEADVQLEVPTLDVGGVMEMDTQADGQAEPATSVAAKGAFARAGEDEIVVAFEYLFRENPAAELVIYLSDKPEVSECPDGGVFEDCHHLLARLQPPAAGRAGSIGSDEFATFYGKFPRGTLNFTRGTYVELELTGTDSRVWIDNWDPQIDCIACSDLNGNTLVDDGDLLLLLAEYGQKLEDLDWSKACLDSGLSGDQYVDLTDILAWDTLLNGYGLNACGTGLPDLSASISPGSGLLTNGLPSSTSPRLIVAGKPNGVGVQNDYLYSLEVSGSCMTAESPADPGAGAGTRSNGRLVKDRNGQAYQLHGTLGLVRLSDGQVVLSPSSDQTCDGNDVYIGVNDTGGGEFVGLPLMDVAFSRTEDRVVYVAPVVIAPSGGCPYRAAAKLLLSDQYDGTYSLQQCYGIDPGTDPALCGYVIPETDQTQVREVEVDDLGNLYVLCAQALNDNDWLLIWDESTGSQTTGSPILLSSVAPEALEGPIAMTVSSVTDTLYLASSIEQPATLPDLPTTRVFRFDIQRTGDQATGISANGVMEIENPTEGTYDDHFATITDMRENSDGALYVAGVTGPRFSEYHEFDTSVDPIFTMATLAVIPSSFDSVTVDELVCHDLALPLSLMFLDGSCSSPRSDINGDGDVDGDDFLTFSLCYNGSLKLPQSGCQSLCSDIDGDNDVDGFDFTTFSLCYNGSLKPPTSGCESP
jgi:hypothetical protein